MLQALISYALVALAAAWVVWNVVLPASLRQRLRPVRARRAVAARNGCASGGCADCSGCALIDDQRITVRARTRDRS